MFSTGHKNITVVVVIIIIRLTGWFFSEKKNRLRLTESNQIYIFCFCDMYSNFNIKLWTENMTRADNFISTLLNSQLILEELGEFATEQTTLWIFFLEK